MIAAVERVLAWLARCRQCRLLVTIDILVEGAGGVRRDGMLDGVVVGDVISAPGATVSGAPKAMFSIVIVAPRRSGRS